MGLFSRQIRLFFLFTLNECTHNEKEIALMHLMAIKYHVYNVFLCN